MPRLRKRNVDRRLDAIIAKRRFPYSASDTLPKKGCSVYANGSISGDKRRKSAPNFEPCDPRCTDRPSTILICCCLFRSLGPTFRLLPCCFNEKISKMKFAFWRVNGLGNGRDVGGTAPPKLSKLKMLLAFVWL